MSDAIDQQLLNKWVAAIYEAALDDALWKSLLYEIGNFIGSPESQLFSPRLKPGESSFAFTSFDGMTEDIWKHYEDYFWQHDVWAIEGIKNGFLKQGTLFTGAQLIDPSNFRNTEIFCDYFKPYLGGYDNSLTLLVYDDKTPEISPCTTLNFYKPSYSESFNANDIKLLRYLEPHIQRALKIRWKLQTQEEAKQLREAALAELSSGVLILNHNGKLVFANPLAEDMLRLGNNPTTNHGKLSSINAYDRSAIDKAIMNANNGLGSTLRFDNLAPIGPRVATFAPFKSNAAWNKSEKYIFVMLSEPNKENSQLVDKIATSYGLSPAESRVLTHLLAKKAPQEIAEVLGVSITTLRTQLKALFAKTGTKNQRELVQFCLENPS